MRRIKGIMYSVIGYRNWIFICITETDASFMNNIKRSALLICYICQQWKGLVIFFLSKIVESASTFCSRFPHNRRLICRSCTLPHIASFMFCIFIFQFFCFVWQSKCPKFLFRGKYGMRSSVTTFWSFTLSDINRLAEKLS